eukprot:4491421-Amphidinium_carterae.2
MSLKSWTQWTRCTVAVLSLTQAHCPSYILRYDIPEIIENSTVDCHRQVARYHPDLSKEATQSSR